MLKGWKVVNRLTIAFIVSIFLLVLPACGGSDAKNTKLPDVKQEIAVEVKPELTQANVKTQIPPEPGTEESTPTVEVPEGVVNSAPSQQNSSIPANVQGYSGCWNGKWLGNTLDSTIEFNVTSASQLTAVYTFPPNAPANQTYVIDGASIKSQNGVFNWTLDGDTLEGVRKLNGNEARIKMTRCGLTASAPLQAPAPQAQAPQAPRAQVPAPQAPAPQAPRAQVPAPQVPAPQAQAPQAPAPQAPKPQAPVVPADMLAFKGCWKGTWDNSSVSVTWYIDTATNIGVAGSYKGDGNYNVVYEVQPDRSVKGWNSAGAVEVLRIQGGSLIGVRTLPNGQTHTITATRC